MNIPHVWVDTAHEYHVGSKVHPEQPGRITLIIQKLMVHMNDKIVWHKREDLFIKNDATSPEWFPTTDGDTYYTEYTSLICKRVNLMIDEAVNNIITNNIRCSFILCRPPGHHAGVTAPRGFCHQNNVWYAVELLYKKFKNIAILDWDVHHGDGTEELVRKHILPGVRFISIHAYGTGIYPGTGKSSKDDHVLNIGLPKGTKEKQYLDKFYEEAVPYIGKPDILIVSAGYDAHEADPMKLMKLHSSSYGIMSGALKEIGCPVMFVLEGGYKPIALGDSVVETLKPWITE
jgi:acetoin utilization deacetylase AcuC-like enzyme